MPMNILFVDPPGKNKGLNTGLAYLVSALNKSHRVHVLDLNNLEMGLCGDPNPGLSREEIRQRVYDTIDDFEPDIFGVSVKTFSAHIAIKLFGFAKQRKKDMITIAGGPHITLDGARYIEDSGSDFGIAGEGESSFPTFCNTLGENDDFSSISGFLYRKNGKVVTNPRTPAYAQLDELRFPDYTNFTSVEKNNGIIPQYPILTSRGCPFSCSYCSMPSIMGRKWRCHSPQYVIRELGQAKNKYGSCCFTVVDDCFTLDLKRIEAISDRLVSSRLNLKWNSQNGIRADRITESLALKMKQSGCYHVWIGIETADEKVFETINKGEKLAKIREGIEILKRAGIGVGGFFIIGLPYSTKDSDLKSVAFVKDLKIDAWWFNFVPYPFTLAWDWVQRNARVLRSPEGVLQYGSSEIEWVFETENYSEYQRKIVYKRIHFSMGYFDRLFDPSAGQVKNLIRLFSEALKIKPGALLSFLLFVPRYNLTILLKKFRSKLQILKSNIACPLSSNKDIDVPPQCST